MISVKLMGGLGNQMFQYAAAKSLALKWGTNLVLDLSYLNDRTPKLDFTFRDFELDVFCLSAKISNLSLEHSFMKKMKNYFCSQKIYVEEGLKFDPSFFSYGPNSFISGYFQSENYFLEIRDILLQEFRLKEISEKSLEVKRKIDSCNSVSLHVRRGDYVNVSVIRDIHGVCAKDYYDSALLKIRSSITDPTFFIFSDDLDWAKENFRYEADCLFVDHNSGKNSCEDMYLMSQCKHNILANSSFSWWGAWLNTNIDKMVIAPKKWFNKVTIDTSDLIPVGWQKI